MSKPSRKGKRTVRTDKAAAPPEPHAACPPPSDAGPSHVFGFPVVGTVNADGTYTPTPDAAIARRVVAVDVAGTGPRLVAGDYGPAVDPDLVEHARWMLIRQLDHDIYANRCGPEEALRGCVALAELAKVIFCICDERSGGRA